MVQFSKLIEFKELFQLMLMMKHGTCSRYPAKKSKEELELQKNCQSRKEELKLPKNCKSSFVMTKMKKACHCKFSNKQSILSKIYLIFRTLLQPHQYLKNGLKHFMVKVNIILEHIILVFQIILKNQTYLRNR